MCQEPEVESDAPGPLISPESIPEVCEELSIYALSMPVLRCRGRNAYPRSLYVPLQMSCVLKEGGPRAVWRCEGVPPEPLPWIPLKSSERAALPSPKPPSRLICHCCWIWINKPLFAKGSQNPHSLEVALGDNLCLLCGPSESASLNHLKAQTSHGL